MKKKILLIVFCLVAVCVYGQDISAFWGMGSIDYSLYESEDITWGYMNNVELLDVTIRDDATGLQLNLTPFHGVGLDVFSSVYYAIFGNDFMSDTDEDSL